MPVSKILLYELLLIFASVFIFRSLWMIYDRMPWMMSDVGIAVSLVAGVLITMVALVKLNRLLDKKPDNK